MYRVKMSFETKFIFIFLLVVLSIFIFSAIIYRNNELQSDNNYWENHTQQVLYKSEKVLSILKDIEIGNRGFLITRDSSYLMPFTRAKENINTSLVQLFELTASDSIQHSRVDSLRKIVTKKIEVATMVSTITPNGYESNRLLLSLLADGKTEMDKIRTIISKIEDEESSVLQLRQRIKNDNYQNLKTTFYVLFATMFFILLLAYFVIRHNFLLLKEFKRTLA